MKIPRALLGLFITSWLFAAAALAADASPTGTWKWTVQGRQGGQGFEQTLTLDYKEGKLTGILKGVQGGQFSVPDTPIQAASFADGRVKFAITRDFNGRSFTTTYDGKLEGDTIKGSFERAVGGNPVKSDWLARRQK